MKMANEKMLPPRVLTGEMLLAWRERMGFTQTDACVALGCSRNAWASWESGAQMPPRYIGLACDALALGVQPYETVGDAA
jgi:transcriptional regulator with XRE-family HTH domain